MMRRSLLWHAKAWNGRGCKEYVEGPRSSSNKRETAAADFKDRALLAIDQNFFRSDAEILTYTWILCLLLGLLKEELDFARRSDVCAEWGSVLQGEWPQRDFDERYAPDLRS